MKLNDRKDSEHKYKGFTIKGILYVTRGGYVLGGRHYKEGGEAREYKIFTEDNSPYMGKYLITKLKDAKEYIDEFIKIRTTNISRMKIYKDNGRTKESLIFDKIFPSNFIEKYYDNL